MLTAAHCKISSSSSQPLLGVIIGAYDLVDEEDVDLGLMVEVADVVNHPDYDDPDYDVSVIILKEAVSSSTPLMQLPSSSLSLSANQDLQVIGFGTTSEGGSTASVLRYSGLVRTSRRRRAHMPPSVPSPRAERPRYSISPRRRARQLVMATSTPAARSRTP